MSPCCMILQMTTFNGLVLGLGGGGQWRCRLKTTLYTDRNFNCNLVIDSRTC